MHKENLPPHNQIPLVPPFPKGDQIPPTFCSLTPVSSQEDVAHDQALDAGFLNRNGIETIMFGPGDLSFAHTDQEAVSLQEVRDAAKIYAATALQLLA